MTAKKTAAETVTEESTALAVAQAEAAAAQAQVAETAAGLDAATTKAADMRLRLGMGKEVTGAQLSAATSEVEIARIRAGAAAQRLAAATKALATATLTDAEDAVLADDDLNGVSEAAMIERVRALLDSALAEYTGYHLARADKVSIAARALADAHGPLVRFGYPRTLTEPRILVGFNEDRAAWPDPDGGHRVGVTKAWKVGFRNRHQAGAGVITMDGIAAYPMDAAMARREGVHQLCRMLGINSSALIHAARMTPTGPQGISSELVNDVDLI